MVGRNKSFFGVWRWLQEEIFDLREMMEAADITDREKQIITQMQGFMLKLSFILRGKQNKTKKLLDFLKSCWYDRNVS